MNSSASRLSVGHFSDRAHSAREDLALNDLLDHQLQSTQASDYPQGRRISDEDRVSGLREFSLPPVDKGKDAWLCLAGAFFLELMVWGMYHPEDLFEHMSIG